MRTAIGLSVISVFFLGSATAQDAKKDLEKLAGRWDVTELTYNGKEHNLKIKIIFKGAEGVVEGNDKVTNEYAKIKIKLEPDTKPRGMDITIVAGSQTDATMEGIYELKNDELRICAKVFGKDRPTEFAAPAGSSIVLMTLKRAGP